MPLTKNVWGFFEGNHLSSLMSSFCVPFPGVEIVCLKEKDFGPVLSRFDGLVCTTQWTLHLHDIWYVASVSLHKRVSLPCIFRQGKVLLAMRSCDAICHIWSWSCFGTHRPLFSDHILQDQGSPRSKTLSITNLRSGADISLADKSNPIWSKLTALHRFLCEFSLVWWGSGGS